MGERNVINGVSSVVLFPLLEFYKELMPLLFLAVVLTLVDLRFGVQAARKRGENIRLSRAARRTVNKLVDYICWVTLSGLFGDSFGVMFGIPILSTIMLIVIYGIEVNSCYQNYFEYRGINKKFNIFSALKKSVDIEEPTDKE